MKSGDRVRIVEKGFEYNSEGVIVRPSAYFKPNWVVLVRGDYYDVFKEKDLELITTKNVVIIEDMT